MTLWFNDRRGGPVGRGRPATVERSGRGSGGRIEIRKWCNMGEKQFRSVGPGCVEVSCRPRRRTRIRSNGTPGLRRAVIVLGIAAMTSHGPHAARAPGQETPVRSELPKVPVLADSAQVTAEALSMRYNFTERYSPTDVPSHPEVLTQYQVGIVETTKTETEREQGRRTGPKSHTGRSTRSGPPRWASLAKC